jgi:hypothetical protein
MDLFLDLLVALSGHRPIWKSGEFFFELGCPKIGRFQNRGTFNFTTPSSDDPLFEIGRFEKARIAFSSNRSFLMGEVEVVLLLQRGTPHKNKIPSEDRRSNSLLL